MLLWWGEPFIDFMTSLFPPLEHTIGETFSSCAAAFLWCIPRRLPRGAVEIDSELEIVSSALIPRDWLFHRTSQSIKTTSCGLGESTKKEFGSVSDSPQKNNQFRSLRVHRIFRQQLSCTKTGTRVWRWHNLSATKFLESGRALRSDIHSCAIHSHI